MIALSTDARASDADIAPPVTAATSLEIFWTDFNPYDPGFAFRARCQDRLLMAGPITAASLDEAIEKAMAATAFACDDETLELRDDELRWAMFMR